MEELEIHPADATQKGIETGDEVRVFNQRGDVVLRARVSEAVQPGVLYSPKGTWLKTSPTGRTINVLLDADIRTDIIRGACCNETYVDISPADG